MSGPVRLALLAALLALPAAGCGGDDGPGAPLTPSPEPVVQPGTVSVSVTSPRTDDGAMLFSVSGKFQSIEAAAGYQVLNYAPNPSVTRVMIVGSIASGTVFSLNVADKSLPVTVTLDQVAARATYVQRSPGGYRVNLVR